MTRKHLPPALVLTIALAAGLPALAQPPDGRPDGPPPGRGPGQALFISPCGEPFRGPDGLTAWFRGADGDHDGALTLAEFRADAMRFFKVVDANGDGVIDGLENRIYETRIAPEILGADREDAGPRLAGPRGAGPPDGPRGPRRGGERPGRREGAARFSLLNEPQPVRGADADLDWRVTAAEWSKATGRRFALLDPGGSGRLVLADLPASGGTPPRR